MSRTNDMALEEQQKIIEKLSEKYSKEAIEDFFGIVIKKIDSEEHLEGHLYNLYMDNELVQAELIMYEMALLFKSVMHGFICKMCEEAEKDDNIEGAQRMVAELEAREIANEEANYYTCPACGRFVKHGTHFHH